MHRRNSLQWQQVIHHRKHAFFHFTAVPGAADDLHAFGHVEGDKIFRVKPHCLVIGVGGLGTVKDDEIGLVTGQFLSTRADEHVGYEMRLPGHFGDESHLQSGVRIGATKGIDDKQPFAGQLLGHQLAQRKPGLAVDRLVVIFSLVRPPDAVARGIVAHQVLVLGGAPGEIPRVDRDGARFG